MKPPPAGSNSISPLPVAITANTTYIASYHTSSAFFADFNYFQNQGVDNPPLHALQDGVDGPNGVYLYGAGGVFPNQTYSANNYWVDVVFTIARRQVSGQRRWHDHG